MWEEVPVPSKPLTVVSARALGSPCVKHTGDGALRWAPPDASGIYGAVVAFQKNVEEFLIKVTVKAGDIAQLQICDNPYTDEYNELKKYILQTYAYLLN